MSNTNYERFIDKICKTEGCWIWKGGKAGNGYGYFYYNGYLRYAHRVSLTLFKDYPIDIKLEAMHSCDNPSCVNPDHLTYGTHHQNMIDAANKCRMVNVNDWSGQKNPKSKLSQEQRCNIEEMIRNKINNKIIANKFNISSVRVYQIAKDINN